MDATRRKSSQQTRCAPCETLEIRRLLAVLNVSGTGGDDTISLDVAGKTISVIVNSTPLYFSDLTYDGIQIDAADGNDVVDIFRTGDNPVTIAGGLGNDLLHANLGLDGITSSLFFDGGFGGSDEMDIFDTASPQDRNYTVAARTLVSGPTQVSYLDCEALRVEATAGDNFFSIDLSTSETIVIAVGGPGIIRANAAITLPDALSTACFVGGGASQQDELTFTDSANPYTDPYQITSATITRPFFAGIGFERLERVNVTLGPGNNRVSITEDLDVRLVVDTGSGNDTLSVLADSLEPIVFHTGNGVDDVNIDDPAGGVSAILIAADELGAVHVGAGDRLTFNPAADYVVRCRQLSIDAGGTLDLADQSMIIDYTGASPLATINGSLTSGYNAGLWNGPGINSSLASGSTGIGVAEATDVFAAFPVNFAGLSIDASSVLLRFTLYGDANLDRTVNLADFARVGASFNTTPRRWSEGDFNFDAVANIADFAVLAAAFNQTLIPARRPVLIELH